MSAARSVTASFNVAATNRMVTLSKSGTGTGSVSSSPSGLSCPADCSGATASCASTSAVTLTAQAANGSTFAGWSGACTGTSSCTIPAGTSNVNVTAIFDTENTVVLLREMNISGNLGSSRYFSIAVPAGATNLKIQTSGGTGDADLYVRFAQAPTLSMYDCKGIGGNNLCHIPAPNNGEYHIMLHGVQSFSGLVLTADYQKEQGKKVDITNIINLLLLD